MRYATENRCFLSFARNLGRKTASMVGDKLIKQGQDASKIAAKRARTKTAEATGDLIGQKFADKITKPKKKTVESSVYISPEQRQKSLMSKN